MDLQLFCHTGNKVTENGDRFAVLTPRQGQRIGFLKRAQEERVLRNKAEEEIGVQRAREGRGLAPTFRRFGLAVAPRFLWECLTNRTVNGFPAPATSHVACGFPALRAYSWCIRELADGKFPPSSKRVLWKKMNLRDAETRRRLPCGYEFTTREQARCLRGELRVAGLS